MPGADSSPSPHLLDSDIALYRIKEVPVLLHCRDREIRSRLDAFMKGHGPAVDGAGAPGAEMMANAISFEILRAEPGRNVLADGIHFEAMNKQFSFNQLDCYLAQGRHYFTDGASLGITDPAGGSAHIVVAPSTLNLHRFFTHTFFCIMLAEMLRSRGLYHLHASAVAESGTGILLVGDTGSGKSTLALNLVRSGFGYLSDDAVLLDRADGPVKVYPFPGEFHIDPRLVEFFPELALGLEPEPYAGGDKRIFDPSAVYPCRALKSAIPKAIIFPCRVDGASTLRELSPREALGRLIRSSLLVMLNRDLARNHLDVLKQLADQCRSLELESGPDLLQAGHGLAGMLESAGIFSREETGWGPKEND